MLLHKSLGEILELSPLEIEIWRAYLPEKQEKQAEQRMAEQQEAAIKAALGRR